MLIISWYNIKYPSSASSMYRIPGNFYGMYISLLAVKSWIKFCRLGYPAIEISISYTHVRTPSMLGDKFSWINFHCGSFNCEIRENYLP